MGKRTYLYSGLKAEEWLKKASSGWCAVCDCKKPPDDICCHMCWLHLKETQQKEIVNLIRMGRIGWALRKMCAWSGRASMPTKRDIKRQTLPLFEILESV